MNPRSASPVLRPLQTIPYLGQSPPMPRRMLLTEAQRAQFMSPPTEERDILRHFTLDSNDLALIARRRGGHNRLGFAVLLCYLRFPGRVLAPGETPPMELLDYVASQLGIAPSGFAKYALRDQTRRAHLAELQEVFGYRQFTGELDQELRAWLLPVALNIGRGTVLVAAVIEELRRHRILLPPVATIERLCSEVRFRAERQTFHTLTANLTEGQIAGLESLLTSCQDSPQSQLAWLRQPAGAATPRAFTGLVERLRLIRGLGLDPAQARTIHQNRLSQIAREGGQSTVQHLLDFERQRRLATLVAVALDLSATITDEAVEMFDKMLGSMFRKSERRYAERFQQSAKAINEKVRQFAQVGRALIEAKKGAVDPFRAIMAVIPWKTLESSVQEAEALARPEEFDYLEILGERYAMLRKYGPTLLSTFEFRASTPAKPLMKAIEMIQEMNDSGRRTLPSEAPTAFIKKRWKRLVYSQGRIDRRYYELCVMAELRDRLRAGDVWVAGSRQYRDFEDYLLPQASYDRMRMEGSLPLAVEPDFSTFMERKREALSEALARVCVRAAVGSLPDVTIENGRLSVAPIRKATPDEALALAGLLYGMLPRVKITELLQEVDSWTRFTDQFVHLRTGLPAEDKEAILSAILADGINLGLARMADACKTVSLRRLAWTADWHIRDECYSQALAQVIDAQHNHPFSRHWGEGTSSSSDGQHYRAGGRGKASSQLNARYGNDPGVMFYTHVSDQFGPYHVKVISATESEAPHVLDGLLYHDSCLEVREHHTDTGGATEHIFALCHLLGFTFAPRIRDLKDRRLYVFGRASDHPALSGLIAGQLNVRRIEAQWEEILRLAASIKIGTVTASLMLKKLAAYPRQNGLAMALRELGRLERTLFTMHWLENPEQRRKAGRELNKGEGRHALGRAVFFNRLGEIRDRSFENQRYRASGLNLLTAAIILWNTVYLAKAVEVLRGQDVPVEDSLLPHVAPLGWEHINLTGDYVWSDAQDVEVDRLRQIRSPASLLAT